MQRYYLCIKTFIKHALWRKALSLWGFYTKFLKLSKWIVVWRKAKAKTLINCAKISAKILK